MATVATIGVRPRYATPTKGSVTEATDTQIIAAPGAGLRLVVNYLALWCPSSNSTATTVTVKWGDETEVYEIDLAPGEGTALYFESGNEWVLPSETALVLTTSAAEKVQWAERHLVESAA